MISPKEEANKLVHRMLSSMMPHRFDKDDAKQCALIAVDEILRNHYFPCNEESNLVCNVEYWNEVKQEIEKL